MMRQMQSRLLVYEVVRCSFLEVSDEGLFVLEERINDGGRFWHRRQEQQLSDTLWGGSRSYKVTVYIWDTRTPRRLCTHYRASHRGTTCAIHCTLHCLMRTIRCRRRTDNCLSLPVSPVSVFVTNTGLTRDHDVP